MLPSETPTDRALMLLPYEKWVTIASAARHAGVDQGTALSIVRAGRRRGVLRTRGKGSAQQVMRVHPGPRRLSRRPAGPQA